MQLSNEQFFYLNKLVLVKKTISCQSFRITLLGKLPFAKFKAEHIGSWRRENRLASKSDGWKKIKLIIGFSFEKTKEI